MFLPVIIVFVIGFLLHSKIMTLSAAAGFLIGIFLSIIAFGAQGPGQYEYYLITSTPIAISLGGFFLLFNLSSIIYTLIAIFSSLFMYLYLKIYLFGLRLPILTAPFAFTTFIFLLIVSILPEKIRKKLKLYKIPLVRVTSPEEAIKWVKKEEEGEMFWRIFSGTKKEKPWKESLEKKIDKAAQLMLFSKKIVALTGAGISTESGIPDYRTDFIAWKKYDTSHFRYENFLRSEYSRMKYWEMSQDFYLLIKQANPNPAHLALVELEHMGKLLGIITQNVDRLHQKAGNSPEKIIELHGNELTVTCLNCGKKYPRSLIYDWIINGVKVPYCVECQGILKPDSVAFGQPMPYLASKRAFELVSNADLLLVVGTSLQVQPAALLPWKAKENGAKLIIINLTPTQYDQNADVLIKEKAGTVLPKIIERMKELTLYIKET